MKSYSFSLFFFFVVVALKQMQKSFNGFSFNLVSLPSRKVKVNNRYEWVKFNEDYHNAKKFQSYWTYNIWEIWKLWIYYIWMDTQLDIRLTADYQDILVLMRVHVTFNVSWKNICMLTVFTIQIFHNINIQDKYLHFNDKMLQALKKKKILMISPIWISEWILFFLTHENGI